MQNRTQGKDKRIPCFNYSDSLPPSQLHDLVSCITLGDTAILMVLRLTWGRVLKRATYMVEGENTAKYQALHN